MHPDTELQPALAPAPMAHSGGSLRSVERASNGRVDLFLAESLVVLCVELWAVCRWVGGVVGMVLAVFVVV